MLAATTAVMRRTLQHRTVPRGKPALFEQKVGSWCVRPTLAVREHSSFSSNSKRAGHFGGTRCGTSPGCSSAWKFDSLRCSIAAAAVAAATAAATATVAATASSSAGDEAESSPPWEFQEPAEEFYQFGARRDTPAKHKNQVHTPRDKRQCSGASCHASRGPRGYMEDEHYVAPEGIFFAVYDGHGGSGVSQHLEQHLWTEINSKLSEQNSYVGLTGNTGKDVSAAVKSACAKVQEQVAAMSKFDHQGSTASCVMLENGRIWSINVGDSRAVLCRSGTAIDLTSDHKPDMIEERQRIEALGGQVQWYGWEDAEGHPVPGMGAWRVNGNLGVSRSFGDKSEVPFVTAEPEVKCFNRDYLNDQFIIIASDGLWDVFESQEAVDYVNSVRVGMHGDDASSVIKHRRSSDRRKIRASMEERHAKMSRYLVEEALRRGTLDNTTVVLIWLR